jgi:hypothetical protein
MNYCKCLFRILIFTNYIFFSGVAFGQINPGSGKKNDHLINNEKYRSKVTEMLAKQKELAKGREEELFGIFKSNLSNNEHEALEFLYAFMPLSDLSDYDGKFYLDQVRATLKARDEIQWVKKLPEEIFLHFVLPIRVNNENLDPFRVMMYDELKNRVKGLSMKDAALEINHWCHEKVTYRPSDARTSSPLSTMRTSWGRCGEESVFTVEALRTVGIPARQVYTPRWAHTDDNHAWIEVWIDGKWYFLGACEPEADLNMGWFAEPSRRAMLVHTRVYGWYLGNETVITTNERFSELNLISNYAPSKTFIVKVIDEVNKPVENAKVGYRLYNYCEFFPLAQNFTNHLGTAQFTTGLGDLLIWANKDNKYGFQKISVGKVDTVSIKILDNHPKNYSIEYGIIPPMQPVPREVSENGREVNQCRLIKEDSIRIQYDNTFKDSIWTIQLAAKLKLNTDSLWNIFKKNYGNWNEITEFLEQNNNKYNQWSLRFLYSISEKDLRDSKAATLEEHLINGFTYTKELADSDQGLFTDYVLSPRIGLEFIRPWRSFLQNKFDNRFAQKAQNDISIIVEWIKKNIRIDDDANLLSRCPVSPKGVYELKISDTRSRNIFFVALCRSMGIPSRLNPVNNIPQYYADKTWQDISFEKKQETITGKGFIHFINASSDIEPHYYTNFTIGKLTNGVFETLEFEEDKPISKFADKIEADAGDYMLITGKRLTDGSVLTMVTFFEVKSGELSNVTVKVRTLQIKPEKIGTIKTDNLKLQSFTDNKTILLNTLVKDKGAVLVWLDPDKEPSKHVLSDLPAFNEQLNLWGGNIVFLLSKGKVNAAFNPSSYKNLPSKSHFIFDLDNATISEIEKIKNRDLQNNYPIVIACDSKGNIIFFSEGYTIGIGDQLATIIKLLN